MSKIMDFVSLMHSVFYGEYWYIAWGVVLAFFVPAVIIEARKLVRSIKETKKRSKTK